MAAVSAFWAGIGMTLVVSEETQGVGKTQT